MRVLASISAARYHCTSVSSHETFGGMTTIVNQDHYNVETTTNDGA
jgi:hypothetical protein